MCSITLNGSIVWAWSLKRKILWGADDVILNPSPPLSSHLPIYLLPPTFYLLPRHTITTDLLTVLALTPGTDPWQLPSFAPIITHFDSSLRHPMHSGLLSPAQTYACDTLWDPNDPHNPSPSPTHSYHSYHSYPFYWSCNILWYLTILITNMVSSPSGASQNIPTRGANIHFLSMTYYLPFFTWNLNYFSFALLCQSIAMWIYVWNF